MQNNLDLVVASSTDALTQELSSFLPGKLVDRVLALGLNLQDAQRLADNVDLYEVSVGYQLTKPRQGGLTPVLLTAGLEIRKDLADAFDNLHGVDPLFFTSLVHQCSVDPRRVVLTGTPQFMLDMMSELIEVIQRAFPSTHYPAQMIPYLAQEYTSGSVPRLHRLLCHTHDPEKIQKLLRRKVDLMTLILESPDDLGDFADEE